MTDETDVSTAETPASVIEADVNDQTAQESAQEAAPVASEASAATETPAAEDKPKRTPWWEERFGQLTHQRQQEATRADTAEQRLAAALELLKAQGVDPATLGAQPTPQNTPSPSNPTEFQRAVHEEATRVAARQAFIAKCNDVYGKGVSQFPDFDQAVGQLQKAGVMDDSFLGAALATDNPEAVLHRLGQDPGEAMRIAQLPVEQRAIHLDRMARDIATPKSRPVSAAPAPINPVGGAHAAKAFDPSDTDMPMDEWVRMMDRRDAEKRQRA